LFEPKITKIPIKKIADFLKTDFSGKNIALICDKDTKKLVKNIPIIISKNPRLDFSRIMMKFFVSDEFKPGIHRSTIIEKNSSIGKNVYIGPHCYIGKNVKIGNNVKILSNTSIFGRTKIGDNSIILSNTTIGSEGFGFIFDGKSSFHFPHVGSITIGKDVWIGSNSTIEYIGKYWPQYNYWKIYLDFCKYYNLWKSKNW